MGHIYLIPIVQRYKFKLIQGNSRYSSLEPRSLPINSAPSPGIIHHYAAALAPSFSILPIPFILSKFPPQDSRPRRANLQIINLKS